MDELNNQQTVNLNLVSDKSKTIALLLCLFFGTFGLHHFYVGKTGKGILYIFTFGFLGIGCLVDIVRICTNQFKDKNGALLKKWELD